MKDYSLPENRRELFNRYFKWRVLTHDLDHTHYCTAFCEDYDYERRAWFAFTFGMTYRTPQSYVFTQEFPYITETDMTRLEEWHDKNWRRTTYGTDARYNKSHFATQTKSVLQWLDGKTFEEKINSIIVFDTQRENFWALYKEVTSLYKYGRMTGWLTMQALYDLLKLPIDPEEIMLEGYSPKNDSSLGSIWNGLCALTNKPEKMVGKYGSFVPDKKDIEWSRELLLFYTSKAEDYAGFKIDSFRKESIWCQYKRLFNENETREYPGHASGDATSRYMYYRNNWPEYDWTKFRRALLQQPGLLKGVTYMNSWNKVFGTNGVLLNMHELFPDMENGYDKLGIDLNEYLVKELWLDEGLEVPTIDTNNSTFFEDLKTTPKYYKGEMRL